MVNRNFLGVSVGDDGLMMWFLSMKKGLKVWKAWRAYVFRGYLVTPTEDS
jgi:hypothetical protein